MNNARFVSKIQSLANLECDMKRDGGREPVLVERHQARQVDSVDKFHRDVEALIGPAKVEDMNDVCVTQRNSELGFANESSNKLLVACEARQDAFDRKRFLEAMRAKSARAIDFGHPTRCKVRNKLVALNLTRCHRSRAYIGVMLSALSLLACSSATISDVQIEIDIDRTSCGITELTDLSASF